MQIEAMNANFLELLENIVEKREIEIAAIIMVGGVGGRGRL